MENVNVNDVITSHIGWAKCKANSLSKRYHVDFDDVFSYALESVWKAISYKTKDDCNLNPRWFAAVFLKRRVVDMVRKANAEKRKILFEYVDFDQVHAGSVTFPTAYNNPHSKPVEPCVECGTLGGASYLGRNYTARCRGYCLTCYNRNFARAKRTRQN